MFEINRKTHRKFGANKTFVVAVHCSCKWHTITSCSITKMASKLDLYRKEPVSQQLGTQISIESQAVTVMIIRTAVL